MIEMRTRVRQASRVAARVVDGQAVVVVIDTRALHTLNEVGTFVWEAIADDAGREVGELVDAIASNFEVARDEASRDVLSFLSALHEMGAIVEVEASR